MCGAKPCIGRSPPAASRMNQGKYTPPSQRARCEPRPEIVSKARPQSSHTNLPCSLVVGGPLAPPRKRAEQAEQSVLAPLGPGPW